MCQPLFVRADFILTFDDQDSEGRERENLDSSQLLQSLQSLSSRRASRLSTSHEPAVFLCISMLARAVGPKIETEMKSLLDQMFSVGLSPELTSALKVLAQEIPTLHKDIQGEVKVHQTHVHVR